MTLEPDPARHGYLPCIIHSIDRQRYYESFRGTAGRRSGC